MITTPPQRPPTSPTTPETYQVGQEVWLYAGEEDRDGKPIMSGGTIIALFKPFCSPITYYVIRLNNPEWPIYETRDGYMLSPSPDREPFYVHERKASIASMIGISPWVAPGRSSKT